MVSGNCCRPAVAALLLAVLATLPRVHGRAVSTIRPATAEQSPRDAEGTPTMGPRRLCRFRPLTSEHQSGDSRQMTLRLDASDGTNRIDVPTSRDARTADQQHQLVAQVVEARLSPLLQHSFAAEPEESDAAGSLLGAGLRKAPERALRRITRWIRLQNPGMWLILASALVAHQRSRTDKGVELQSIHTQVVGMEQYHITIVTTASLPWMTGTAINPLLRAAYLAKAGKRVTLAVPWIHPSEQALIFPAGLQFETPEEQEAHVRKWLQERAGIRSADFTILFYPGRYNNYHRSILPLGDITRFLDERESDICILEEPEHLTWYYHGPNWRHRFKLVVGIVHTNYIYYARTMPGGGRLQASLLKPLNVWLCQAYCDKVVKLSDTLQPLPRAIVCNVHGVRAEFLDIGRKTDSRFHTFKRGAYFLGKVLWAKGYGFLIDYLKEQKAEADLSGKPRIQVDVYGGGEDLCDVQRAAQDAELALEFHPAVDHASHALREYKVFINPSKSEVLSTATAEALAMGKYVVIQRHPSNAFFYRFRNALTFETPREFNMAVEYALRTQPAQLTAQERHDLSWEGATDRLLHLIRECKLRDMLPTLADHTVRWVHQGVQSAGYLSDAMRYASGGGPISKQSWIGRERFKASDAKELVAQSVAYSPAVSASP